MKEWPVVRNFSAPLSTLSEEGPPWSWGVLQLASCRVCLEGLPSKTSRECGVCPLTPTQGKLLCPSLTLSPVWSLPRSRCWRSTGRFCSSFRHCQPPSAFQRWEFVENIIGKLHLKQPHRTSALAKLQAGFLRIYFSNEGRETLSRCGLKCRVQELTPKPTEWELQERGSQDTHFNNPPDDFTPQNLRTDSRNAEYIKPEENIMVGFIRWGFTCFFE